MTLLFIVLIRLDILINYQELQRYYGEAGSHLSYSSLQFFLAKHAFENKPRLIPTATFSRSSLLLSSSLPAPLSPTRDSLKFVPSQ